jgi:CheY-like chemotaxis protein
VSLAVVLLLAGTQAHYLTGPAMVALFTVAATRPWRTTAWVGVLAFAPLPVLLWRLTELPTDRADSALTYFALIAGAIGWGLFRRSRQQLIASLRDRARLAEATRSCGPRGHGGRREEIAREMHDAIVRAGLRLMLGGAPDIEIAAEAADGAPVLALVAAHRPDLVLMDIRMPGVDGLAATEALRARPGAPEVLVLTTFHTDAHVLGALRAGAAGFLLKDTPPQDIVTAIRTAAAGDPVLSPAVARRLIAHGNCTWPCRR